MKAKKNKSVHAGITVISILILILIFLVFGIIGRIASHSVRRAYTDSDDMIRYVNYENYDQINYYVKNNRFLEVDRNKVYQNFEAVSEYIDKALLKGAYDNEGMTKEAGECLEVMESLKPQMGEYEYVTEKIDELTAEHVIK